MNVYIFYFLLISILFIHERTYSLYDNAGVNINNLPYNNAQTSRMQPIRERMLQYTGRFDRKGLVEQRLQIKPLRLILKGIE